MKASAGDLNKGNFIKHGSDIFQVVKIEHSHVGRGSANIKVKIKGVDTGNTVELSFKPDNIVERLEVDTVEMQYLYASGDLLTFMNNQTYEQVELEAKVVGSFVNYLKEGQSVYILIHDGKAIAIRPPASVKLKVIEAADAVKGNTATGAKKVVTLESGAKVNVPLFIKRGETIVINPETGEYIERSN